MGQGGISGTAVLAALAGTVLAYSAIKGKSVTSSVKALLAGQNPSTVPGDPNLAVVGVSSIPPDSSGPLDTSGAAGLPSGTAAKNQVIGRALAAPYGWSVGTEWNDLVYLWNKESGWNNLAENPSSGAYGIAQALPPSKYPPAAQKPPVGSSDAAAQIAWGLAYIKGRYGSPSVAWAHEVANDWY